MAKDKKKKKEKKRKGILNPEVAKKKEENKKARQSRSDASVVKAVDVYRTNKIAKDLAADDGQNSTGPAPTNTQPTLNLSNLDDLEPGATATSGLISTRGKKAAQEKIKSGTSGVDTSQADPTEVKAAAELIAKERTDEKRPDTTDDEIQAISNRVDEFYQTDAGKKEREKYEADRKAREEAEAAKRASGEIVGAGEISSGVGTNITSTGTDLKSGEPTFEEVIPTPGQERAREQRSPRQGTGIFDPGAQPRGAGQTAAPRRSAKKAEEKLKRVAATPADDPIHVLSQNIRKEELEDQGLMATDADLSPFALNLSNAHTKAIIMTHAPITHEQIKRYMGGEGPNASDKLQHLHDNIMGFVRSTHKMDQAAAMGLVRGEDGKLVKSGKGFATTPTAESQYWQHPTETDEEGMPKTYKVSEMHPDMVKELKHSWGGYRSENPVEGIKSVTFTDPKTKEENTSDVAVSQHFGHHQHEHTGTWRFMKPPANFDDKNSIASNAEAVLSTTGILSNAAAHISRVVAGVPERFKKSRGKDKADELVAAMGGAKRKIFKKKVPMPGFTNEETYQTVYSEEQPKPLTIQDLPAGLDEQGNPVALPPRAGIGGTGRSILTRRGPSMRDAFRGPAAVSADTLKTLTTPESYDTSEHIEKQGNVFVAGATSEEQQQDALTQANERLSGILRANRERAAVGQQFRGAPEKPAKQLAFGEKDSLDKAKGEEYDRDKDFTTYGGKDELRVTPGKPVVDIVEGPIEDWQDRMDKWTIAKGDRLGMTREPGFGRVTYTRKQEVQTNLGTKLTDVVSPSTVERVHTGKPDEQVLRARAEAEATTASTKAVEGGLAGGAKGFATTEYDPKKVTQPTLDFNPRSESPLPYSKQFLGGTIRPLTDAESNVENIGANTERGMNPPAHLFAVGANTPTATPSVVAPPLQTPRGDEPVKKSKAKNKAGAPLERIVNGMAVNIKSGKPKRALRSSPIQSGVRASEIDRTPSGIARDLAARLDARRGAQGDANKQE